VIRLPIKPLSLHHRVHAGSSADAAAGGGAGASPAAALADRPLNTLTFKGDFSLNVAHEWVTDCLPEVPVRPAAGPDGLHTLTYGNAFIGSGLVVTYQRGELRFKSDLVSTLAILNEGVSALATARKVQLKIAFDIDPASMAHILGLLHPKLVYQVTPALSITPLPPTPAPSPALTP
jgi:Bardet-Biedl syndrome 7 protein